MKVKKFAKKSKIVLSLCLVFAMLLSMSTMAFAATSPDINDPVFGSAAAIATDIEREGIVLVKNTGNALPLAASAKVNVFGTGSISPFYGGGGSGDIAATDIAGFYDSLDSAGIQYNTELKSAISSWYDVHKNETRDPLEGGGFGMWNTPLSRNEMPVSAFSDTVKANAKAYSDTAILFISRAGSEGGDLFDSAMRLYDEANFTADTLEKGLGGEKQLMEYVVANYSNIIVVLNISNAMEIQWVEDNANIKAAIMIGAPGQFGMKAVGEVLSGKVNPSGRTVDTFAKSMTDHPSTVNFGEFTYNAQVNGKQYYFVNYNEGIYVGYRYFETFGVPVTYPFGFGLSYTSFTWDVSQSDVVQDLSKDEITFNVKVTNTGTRAGKDVVQLYYTPPYTAGGPEKATKNLLAFAKTDLLLPGSSQTLPITVKTRDMASYATSIASYVLSAGNYQFAIARSVKDTVTTVAGSLASDKVFSTDSATGAAIENRFDDAKGSLTYLSRSNPTGTMPKAPTNYTPPASLATCDNAPAPTTVGTVPTIGANNNLLLKDVYADPSKWDAFLDQFTLDEMVDLVTNGGYQTVAVNRLGVPKTIDNDGPASIKGSGGFAYNLVGIAYPSETVIACTWNTALAQEMGVRIGKEAAKIGTQVWYAPASNIHRNPRAGRNFEYFSEDPLLAGKMMAAEVKGAQSQNLIPTIKHFALNDQETHRDTQGLCTWANEQSIREIYLRPFEIAVKEGKAKGVMSAFNRIGTVWAGGSKALLTDVLRGEWGFDGFVVTDFCSNGTGTGYMSQVQQVYAQGDTALYGMNCFGMLTPPAVGTVLKSTYNADPIGFGQALRLATKNLCQLKMRTNAFLKDVAVKNGNYTMIVEGYDWGPAIPKVVLQSNKVLTSADVSKADFTAFVKRTALSGMLLGTAQGNREITDAYVSDERGNKVDSGNYITLVMKVHPDLSIGSPFNYNFFGSSHNEWVKTEYTVTQTSTGSVWNNLFNQINLITEGFKRGNVSYSDSEFGNINLTYGAYEPENAMASGSMPLVIWLHGAGEGGTDPDVAWLGNKVVNLATEGIQSNFGANGAYVLAPQTPTYWMNNGRNQYTSDGTSMYTRALMNLIEKYVAVHPEIDTNRIYLGGCSNGGFMTMNMITHYPEYFAAAYPVCEAYSDAWITDAQIESIKNIPIWFTQAANDPTVRANLNVLPTYDRLIKAGATNVHLTLWDTVKDMTGLYKATNGTDPYNYNGHWSWLYTLNNECTLDYDKNPVKFRGQEVSIMEWLAKQSKSAVKTVMTFDKTKAAINEKITVTVTCAADVQSFALANENGMPITLKNITSTTSGDTKTFKAEFTVGTAGNRELTAVLDAGYGYFADATASIEITKTSEAPKVESVTAPAKVAVNVVNNYTIKTNAEGSYSANVRSTGASSDLGKTVVSKTMNADGTCTWILGIKIGTAGTNRSFDAYAGNATGTRSAAYNFKVTVTLI